MLACDRLLARRGQADVRVAPMLFRKTVNGFAIIASSLLTIAINES